jgi:hypothetical protein
MADKTVKRVGFWVEVEVEAFEGEHALVATCATQWPELRHDAPLEVHGFINGKPITAQIIYSRPLMYGEHQ